METKEITKEELDAREVAVAQREKEVAELESVKKKMEEEYQKKNKEVLNLKESILTDKNVDIAAKDKELKNLQEQLAKANKELSEKRQELATRKLTIDSEVNAYRDEKLQKTNDNLLAKFQNDINKIQSEYNSYLKSSTDTVKWSEEKLHKAFDELTEEFKKSLEAKEAIVQAKINDLEEAQKEYESAIEESSHIKEQEAQLKIEQKKINLKEKNLESIITKKAQEQAKGISDELNKYKQLYADILEEKNNIGLELQKLRSTISYSDLMNKADLENQIRNLTQANEELIKKFGQYSSTEFDEIKRKADGYETISSKNTELNIKINDLQNQVDIYKSKENQADSLKYQNEMLSNTIRIERLAAVELKKQIDELQSRVDNTKSGVIASETIEIAYPPFKDCPQSDEKSLNEIQWIDGIIAKCKESGYEFSKRLFYSFHTSLKTSDMSPLTVLAGVSGTGKSKLPQLYSRFGGIYFLSVPVQPDWDSPQSLFGYFNSIEKRFNATSLLRALVSFQANKSKSTTKDNITDLSNNVLIVLLDEMNLAHVELYFADLLSKLEERRGENKDIGFEVDLGAGNEKYNVVLTDNVKWVGTMNEDETTKSLSDKVIDRGNVISFPRPEKFERYNKKPLAPESDKIDRAVWENWVNNKATLTDEEANKYMAIVEGINNALKKVNRALGHRVWQSIENYMISHPLVNEHSSDDNREKALNYAFEEALVHKVMPKLRGIDTDGSQKTECLDVIKNILVDNGLTSIVSDYDNAMASVTGTFVWDSAKYLSEDYKME